MTDTTKNVGHTVGPLGFTLKAFFKLANILGINSPNISKNIDIAKKIGFLATFAGIGADIFFVGILAQLGQY